MAIKVPEAKKTRLKLAPHQVILRPLVTEKGVHRVERHNQYAFEVSSLAHKDDIRAAIEELFDVTVLKVRTQNRKGQSATLQVSIRQDKELEKGNRHARRRGSHRLLLTGCRPSKSVHESVIKWVFENTNQRQPVDAMRP